MGSISTDENVELQVIIGYAKVVLKGLTEDKCEATEVITSTAGPEVGQAITMAIEEELPGNELLAVTEDDSDNLTDGNTAPGRQPEFGWRSPLGTRVSVESAPMPLDDVAK